MPKSRDRRSPASAGATRVVRQARSHHGVCRLARLYLVRHGKPAAVWGETADPGLDQEGQLQADAVAVRLGMLGPMPMLVSPLRRTRQTIAPLERKWHG